MPTPREQSPACLDRFMPRFDVRERFETTIRAPAACVMKTAVEFDMQSIGLVRGVFRLREWLMSADPAPVRAPQGILAETRSLGWGLLEQEQGRLVACGAVCQPWLANVQFTALAPERFPGYQEPGQVKIAWTLEALGTGTESTCFAQETRAVATDAEARRKFMRYWRWARFGIIGIRLLLLPAIRRTAERNWSRERGAD